MNDSTKRRKRRRANSILRSGKNSVSKHSQKAGRTGMVQAKRTPAKRVVYISYRPNPPNPS